jgi:hypothetical protein
MNKGIGIRCSIMNEIVLKIISKKIIYLFLGEKKKAVIYTSKRILMNKNDHFISVSCSPSYNSAIFSNNHHSNTPFQEKC